MTRPRTEEVVPARWPRLRPPQMPRPVLNRHVDEGAKLTCVADGKGACTPGGGGPGGVEELGCLPVHALLTG